MALRDHLTHGSDVPAALPQLPPPSKGRREGTKLLPALSGPVGTQGMQSAARSLAAACCSAAGTHTG